MINPNSGAINDGYVRDTDESVESLEAQGIVAKADAACSNPYCLDGYVDQAGSSPDGREPWVDQVPCQVCSPYDDNVDESEIEQQVYDVFLAREWVIPQIEAEVELDGLREIRMVDADCGHRVPASQARSGFVGVTFPMEASACHVCRHGEGCDCGEGEDQ